MSAQFWSWTSLCEHSCSDSVGCWLLTTTPLPHSRVNSCNAFSLESWSWDTTLLNSFPLSLMSSQDTVFINHWHNKMAGVKTGSIIYGDSNKYIVSLCDRQWWIFSCVCTCTHIFMCLGAHECVYIHMETRISPTIAPQGPCTSLFYFFLLKRGL